MYVLPEVLSVWETVATLMVAQCVGETVHGGTLGQQNLCMLAGLGPTSIVTSRSVLAYPEAYREIDAGKDTYMDVLARVSGISLLTDIAPLSFQDYPATDDGAILLCPYGPKPSLDLPHKVWVPLARMLRTYGVPVYLLGSPGQRMDQAAFCENAIMSEECIASKVALLSSARLVVGVPNEWLWLAASWDKAMVCLYPEDVPQRRWFPFASQRFGRCLYDPRNLFIPAVLAGVRALIADL